MATPAQITANRANAQTSTGPRCTEGKSASRFNAFKHGIDAASIVIPGGDRAVYEALAAPTSPRDWPPTDEKTGRPMYFARCKESSILAFLPDLRFGARTLR